MQAVRGAGSQASLSVEDFKVSACWYFLFTFLSFLFVIKCVACFLTDLTE